MEANRLSLRVGAQRRNEHHVGDAARGGNTGDSPVGVFKVLDAELLYHSLS